MSALVLSEEPSRKPPRRKPRSAFPQGWVITGLDQEAALARIDEKEREAARRAGVRTVRRLLLEWAKFTDYHLSRGNLMADWPACWRTWCHNYAERHGTVETAPAPNRTPMSGLARMTGLFDEGEA